MVDRIHIHFHVDPLAGIGCVAHGSVGVFYCHNNTIDSVQVVHADSDDHNIDSMAARNCFVLDNFLDKGNWDGTLHHLVYYHS